MSIWNRKKRSFNPARVADGVPQALAHSAEEATNRLADAVEVASARVAKSAANVSNRAGELGEQLGDRVGQAQQDAKGSTRKLERSLSRSATKARDKLHPSPDAVLKAQLVKTSRELVRDSSELGEAVDSLNAVIRSNRKASAKGRTRLIGGLAIGAGLMYHLDAEHGKERRAATARRLNLLPKGH